MTTKRGRPESPANARKRDVLTPSTESSLSQAPDRSNSLETNITAASRASVSSLGSFNTSIAGSETSDSKFRKSDDNEASSPHDDFSQRGILTPSTMDAIKSTSAPDLTMRLNGSVSTSTNRESSHDGTVISPLVANNFRYPDSVHLTSCIPIESFPMHRSGDVFIKTTYVQPPKVWQLHSNVLARHSPWFARSMQEVVHDQHDRPKWFYYTIKEFKGTVSLIPQKEISKATIKCLQGDAISYISPIKMETSEDADIPNEQSGASSAGEADDTVISMPKKDYIEQIDAYNEVFGAFYNVPLPTTTTNIATALIHAENVVRIAYSLDCLHLLTAHIGVTFLQYRQPLFNAIKNDPARWLLLSMTIKNDNIYTESLIHLVGAHPHWPWPTKRQLLPEEIRRLIARKSSILDHMFLEAERDLLVLTININKQPVVPEMQSQFDTWFVVATFRRVLANEIRRLRDDRNGSLKRGTFFRKLYKGGYNYMDTEEMRRLFKVIMPSAVEIVSEDLAMLKEHAKDYVEDLAKNELMLNIDADEVGYLTCTKVGPKDIPWRAMELDGA